MRLKSNSKIELKKLSSAIKKILRVGFKNLNRNEYRQFYTLLEKYFHLFEEVVDFANKNNKQVTSIIGKNLFDFSKEVFRLLGRQPEPSQFSLKDYDHKKYGPFLGVSDEGSAASIIRQAAFATPKVKSLINPTPIEIGVACDAERLAAVGEVAVGSDEYIDIRMKCVGSILTSTNVGTRLNLRYSKTRTIVYIRSHRDKNKDSLKYQKPDWEALRAFNKIKEILTPFILTPDKNPRPLTILICFLNDDPTRYKKKILSLLIEMMRKDKLIRTSIHKLALLENVKHGSSKVTLLKNSIDMLNKTGIKEIALSGALRYKATSYISLPGVLNYLDENEARKVLPYANKKQILVSTKELVDVETVARNIWTGLNSARLMGLELGKYGLFPLTLDEVARVTKKVQDWFVDWTAAPVLYIDYPIVTKESVYEINSNLVEGIKLWIKAISKNQIPVILIDTADKSKGFKLVKKDKNDYKGLLTFNQIKDINEFANNLNVKTLWAGGISLDQIFEFGKMQVFGIYVTSSAATQISVSEHYKEENMAVEKEPTFKGVFSSKVLLEAGYLNNLTTMKKRINPANKIKIQTKTFIESLANYSHHFSSEKSLIINGLTDLLVNEWNYYLSQ